MDIIQSLGMALEGDGYGRGGGIRSWEGVRSHTPPLREQTHLIGGSKYQGLKNQFDD